eukprot:scaffold147931_cov50-Cyclotella_meneghiniana.AAC.1
MQGNNNFSSFRIPKKKKCVADVANNCSSINSKPSPIDNDNRNCNDQSEPTSAESVKYVKIKIGRIAGYPVLVKQGKVDHDALLLGCDHNPCIYLAHACTKNTMVKVRWIMAGYNGNVPASSVQFKQLNDATLSRASKEVAISRIAKKLSDEDNVSDEDDAPITKALTAQGLDNLTDNNHDEMYIDEDDRDEKLVCYTKSASTGHPVNKGDLGADAQVDDVNAYVEDGTFARFDIGETTIADEIVKQDGKTPPLVKSDEIKTDDEAVKPEIVASINTSKLENNVPTDETLHQTVMQDEVAYSNTSDADLILKQDEIETDDEALKPEIVASSNTTKLENNVPTDDETMQQTVMQDEEVFSNTSNEVNNQLFPQQVTSNVTLKQDEIETDDEAVKPEIVASSNTFKFEYDVPTDDETLQQIVMQDKEAYSNTFDEVNNQICPQHVTSNVTLKQDEIETDDEALEPEIVASNNTTKMEKDVATDDKTQPLSYPPSIITKSRSCHKNYKSRCHKRRKVHAKHFETALLAPQSYHISTDTINSMVVVVDGSDKRSPPTTRRPDYIDENHWKVLSISANDLFIPALPSNPSNGLIVKDHNGGIICRLWPRKATLSDTGLCCKKKSSRLFQNYMDIIQGNKSCSLESGIQVFGDSNSKYVGKIGYDLQSHLWAFPDFHLPREGLTKYIRQLVNGFERWECEENLVLARNATLPECQYFSACALGRNVHFQVHSDKYALTSITTILSRKPCSPQQDAAAHLCFPKAGVAVPMRPGDVISFAPKEPHALSSRCELKDDLIYMSVMGGNSR